MREMATLLQKLAHHRPVVLFIEDVPWGDKAALVVTEQGPKITVDVPLDPNADRPADGSVGTLSLRDVTVTLG